MSSMELIKQGLRYAFLDRDGVINENPVYGDYIKKPSEFKFLPGARSAIKMLANAGYKVVIISNQTGIGKGLFTKQDLKDIDKKMLKGVEALGGSIEATFYCVHHPDSNCTCRKPRTGLLKKATRRTKVDKKHSFFIGDTEKDVIAGNSFGVRTIIVLTGYVRRKDMKDWQIKPDFVANDILSAVKNVVWGGLL